MADREAEARFRAMGKDTLGKLGEAVTRNILGASGIRYINLCEIQFRGAPVMAGGAGQTILPDFDTAGDNWTAYIDAKCKMNSVYHFKTRQVRHGINARNYEHYKAAGNFMNKQAGLLLVELFTPVELDNRWSGTILAMRFSDCYATPGEGSMSDVVFWNRDKCFTLIDEFSPTQLRDLANGNLKRNYRAMLNPIFAPRIEPPRQSTLWT